MNKEIIEKVLLEISTPTGLTYSGDTTICNDEVKDIMNYINSLEQQCKKQKEVIDNIKKCFDDGHFEDYCDCLIIEKYINNYLKEASE